MVERGVGGQRDLLTRLRVAQATAQRFALAGGGEWVEPVAVTVRAAAANLVEASGIDGLHEQVGHRVHLVILSCHLLPRWRKSDVAFVRHRAFPSLGASSWGRSFVRPDCELEVDGLDGCRRPGFR
jgi:hypothetical protein